MEKLSKFVTKFNLNKDPADQISFIGKLSVKYGDDVVARTLVQLGRNAEMSPNLLSVVKQLRDEQVTDWLKNGKSVDDVFDALKLKGDGFRALRSRKLPVMEDYITKFNTKTSGDESVLAVMTKSYGGENNLVPLLAAAKRDPETVTKAKALETDLLTKWRSKNLPPVDIWRRLKFGDSAYNTLRSGKLRVFYKYVKQTYPGDETSVLKKFVAKYGEVEVAKALVTAKNGWTTKDIATKLQSQQLEGWLNSGKSADDRFVLLKIKNDAGLSQKLDILEDYLKLLKSRNPQDGTDMLTVLKNGLSGEGELALVVSKALQTADSTSMRSMFSNYQNVLFERRLKNDQDPMSVLIDVFKVPETKLSAASTEVKWIVSLYKRFYNGAADFTHHVIVNPRRS